MRERGSATSGTGRSVPRCNLGTRNLMPGKAANFRLRAGGRWRIFPIRRPAAAGRLHLPMATPIELIPELLEAGVHFGHQTKRWNPKMKPFIFEKRNQIYIINLDETAKQLQRATEFLQEVTRRGGKILFVGCKKQAQEAVKEAATACGQFYVNQRWLGGTLTNLATIRKSIGRLKYIEQIEESPAFKKMGKQA